MRLPHRLVPLALPLFACTASPSSHLDDKKPVETPTAHVASPAHARSLPFAKIVTREATITIVSTGGDVRYRVADPSGNVLVASATLDELRTTAPLSYEIVRSAIATAGREPSSYVDATYHAPDHGDALR